MLELVRAEAVKCRFCGSELTAIAAFLGPTTRGSETVVVHGAVIEIERGGGRNTAAATHDSTSSDTSSEIAPEAVDGDGVKPAPAEDKQAVRNSTQRRDSVAGGVL